MSATVRLSALACVLAAFAFASVARCDAAIRDAVGFDQNIGTQLPLDVVFADEGGNPVALGALVRDRPAVMVFGYFDCPRLCGVVVDGAIETLREIRPGVGTDFDFIYVSIDPHDTPAKAAERRWRDLRRYGRGDDVRGWHFLTGDEDAIQRVTRAAGFRFRPAPVNGQFSHASGFIVIRPGGVIAQYFLGIDFQARDVAAAIRDAAAGRNGHSVFELLLFCFPESARSTIVVWAVRVLRVATAGFAIGLGIFIVRMLRQERRRTRDARGGAAS
jgi:protein SCO1/2